MMSKKQPVIIYYVAASLDGFIADADGGVDWLNQFNEKPLFDDCADFFAMVDTMVMGRKSFEQVLEFGEWPYEDKPCVVMSSNSELTSEIASVTFSDASPLDVYESDLIHGATWLVGGAELAYAFRTAGLISEYVITTLPILLGDGIPLFQPTQNKPDCLKLINQKRFDNGATQHHYAVIR